MNKSLTVFLAFMCIAYWSGCNDDDKLYFDEVAEVTAGTAKTTGTGGTKGSAGKADTSGTAGASGKDSGWIASKIVDRSTLTDVGTAGKLDYANPGMWACRPDASPNICNTNLDATLIKADGSREVVTHVATENPEFDCFYVYPTVLLNGGPQMVDFSEAGVKLVSDALIPQAARFSQICRLYAPLYRQVGLTSTGGTPTIADGADTKLGLQDVRDAFAYYLKNFNNGRKFVLLGHSQGTSMLTEMIKQDIDPKAKASVREKLISALLIGGSILVPEGEKVGGTYENIPLCGAAGETGCIIAYASFAADKPAGTNAMFGRTTEEGKQVGCVNPAVLSGNSGRYLGSYFRKNISNSSFTPDTPLPADLGTPFALYRDLFKGECVVKDGASYLEISLVKDTSTAEDKRTPPWRSALVETGAGMGLHLVDYQIPLEDLIQAVSKQATEALKPAPEE
jgi:hypothetical protein